MKIERFNEKTKYFCDIYNMAYFGTKLLYPDCEILDSNNIEYLIIYNSESFDDRIDFELFVFCHNSKGTRIVEDEILLSYLNTLHSKNDLKEFKSELKEEHGLNIIKIEDIQLLISSKKFNI